MPPTAASPSNITAVNPYVLSRWSDPRIASDRLPGFCCAVFITSLVFACLRVPLLLVLAIVGNNEVLAANPALAPTIIFEISSSVFIVIFGILANGLLLAKRPTGIPMGWTLVMCVVFSMGVGIWQASLKLAQMDAALTNDPHFAAGYATGVAIAIIFRLCLLGLYIAGLLVFAGWYANDRVPVAVVSRAAPPADGTAAACSVG